MTTMQQPRWSWHWGSFIAYGVACFVVGVVSGLLAAPGVVPLAFGAVLGWCAGWWRWFEVPQG